MYIFLVWQQESQKVRIYRFRQVLLLYLIPSSIFPNDLFNSL